MGRGSGQLSVRLSGLERLFRILPIEAISPTRSQSSEKLLWISHFVLWDASSQEIPGQGFDRRVFWRLSCRRADSWGAPPRLSYFSPPSPIHLVDKQCSWSGEGLVGKGATGGDLFGRRELIEAEVPAVLSPVCDPRSHSRGYEG